MFHDKSHLNKSLKIILQKENHIENLNLTSFFPNKTVKDNNKNKIKEAIPVPSLVKLTDIKPIEKSSLTKSTIYNKNKQKMLSDILKLRESTANQTKNKIMLKDNIKNILLCNLVLQEHNNENNKKIFPANNNKHNKFQKTMQIYEGIK